MNCTPVPRYGYRLGVPEKRAYIERINSDSCLYGGSNLGNGGRIEAEPVPFHGFFQSVSMTLPPLACLILEPGA
jgi:1,4-alpha-glucan branching enzyme